MKTYYLVIGESGVYITHHWFRNEKYAMKRAEELSGKEVLLEEILA